MVNEDIAHEILNQLFSSLESLETQSAAILQFLKDKGIASDEELAGPLEQAGNASNIRWRAARVRIDHLLSSAIKPAQESLKPEQLSSSENKQEPAKTTRGASQEEDIKAPSTKPPEKDTQTAEKAVASGEGETSGESETKDKQRSNAAVESNRNQENTRTGKGPEHAENQESSEQGPRTKTA